MKNLQKGFIANILIAIIAILIVGGGAYWYLDQGSKSKEMTTSTEGVSLEKSTTPVNEVASWKTYHSDTYGIAFVYPPSWVFTEKINSNAVNSVSNFPIFQVNFSTGGKQTMSVSLYSKEYAKNFKNNYDRFSYFHIAKSETIINNLRTIVGEAGCYECYGQSESAQTIIKPMSITCNASDICFIFELDSIPTEYGSDLKSFFSGKFLPGVMFLDSFLNNKIKSDTVQAAG